MKVVLFCGGEGMRMRELSTTVPKPMVPLGYRPVLWHLMRYYAHYGHRDFILCLGYQGDVVRRYFMDYKEWLSNDFVYSEGGARIELLKRDIDGWRITFAETGRRSNVGERLIAVRRHLEGEELFLANYADVLTDLPLPDLIEHAVRRRKIATFLAVRPSQTFHVVSIGKDHRVQDIQLARAAGFWINGGFFVLRQSIFDVMQSGEDLVNEPFQRLIARRELMAYRYDGYWVGMDTFKERQQLEDLFTQGRAPWAVWERDGACPATGAPTNGPVSDGDDETTVAQLVLGSESG
jgi:glucose-1-phosphate cytidylyltransferase